MGSEDESWGTGAVASEDESGDREQWALKMSLGNGAVNKAWSLPYPGAECLSMDLGLPELVQTVVVF